MRDSAGMERAPGTGTPESDELHGGNWYVLAFGLPKPNLAVTLAPGLSLQPLEKPLSVFTLAAAGAAGFNEWAVLEPMAPGCTCEIESARDADTTPGYNTLNRAWLASALLVLRGYTKHFCVACSAYSWTLIATHEPGLSDRVRKALKTPATYKPKRELPRFKGRLLDFHVTHLIDNSPRTDPVSIDDLKWIHNHFNTFNRLAAESRSFRFALEAATDWRFATKPTSAIARLWSGIEAIFGISSELVYRISLLGASLLEARGPQRRQRFQAIKRLYGFRSKAIHGSKLSEGDMGLALNDSYCLLRDLLLLTIEKGHVLKQQDFDQAVFD